MIQFSSIMIGSSDPKKLADFYQKVFGKKVDWSMGEWFGFKIGETFLTIGSHSEVGKKSKEPQRIMINYYTKEVEKDFKRIIKDAKAKVVKEPYHPEEGKDAMIATLEDPDGNYFQLATPWEQ